MFSAIRGTATALNPVDELFNVSNGVRQRIDCERLSPPPGEGYSNEHGNVPKSSYCATTRGANWVKIRTRPSFFVSTCPDVARETGTQARPMKSS